MVVQSGRLSTGVRSVTSEDHRPLHEKAPSWCGRWSTRQVGLNKQHCVVPSVRSCSGISRCHPCSGSRERLPHRGQHSAIQSMASLYDKEQTIVSLQELHQRAWAIRHKIVQRVKGIPVSENLIKIWEATMEDVHEGSLGPFGSEEEVTRVLDQEDWIPTQRFEVVQKNKVRGCDSATTNLINQATAITEKLQLPSTDTNVAALRSLRSACIDQNIAGWVLDERKAYRQIPVRCRSEEVFCDRHERPG